MKVELTTPEKEKAFEPFSVTFTFETEQEACNMWHRLNSRPKFGENPSVRFVYNSKEDFTEFSLFDAIMLKKGLKQP